MGRTLFSAVSVSVTTGAFINIMGLTSQPQAGPRWTLWAREEGSVPLRCLKTGTRPACFLLCAQVSPAPSTA